MAGNARRQRWQLWQWRQRGLCKLQNPKEVIGSESHPLRHPSPNTRFAPPPPSARCARGFGGTSRGFGWLRRVTASSREGCPPQPANAVSVLGGGGLFAFSEPHLRSCSATREGCRIRHGVCLPLAQESRSSVPESKLLSAIVGPVRGSELAAVSACLLLQNASSTSFAAFARLLGDMWG